MSLSVGIGIISQMVIHQLVFQAMLTQLRAIFDIIVEFQAKQSRMYTECLQEIKLRQQYNATGEAHTDKVCMVTLKHMYFMLCMLAWSPLILSLHWTCNIMCPYSFSSTILTIMASYVYM